MTEQEKNNKLRCYASEIIIKLREADELKQLELLKMLLDGSIDQLQQSTKEATNEAND